MVRRSTPCDSPPTEEEELTIIQSTFATGLNLGARTNRWSGRRAAASGASAGEEAAGGVVLAGDVQRVSAPCARRIAVVSYKGAALGQMSVSEIR